MFPFKRQKTEDTCQGHKGDGCKKYTTEQLQFIHDNRPYPKPWKKNKETGEIPYGNNKVLSSNTYTHPKWTTERVKEVHDKVYKIYDRDISTLAGIINNPPKPECDKIHEHIEGEDPWKVKYGFDHKADTVFRTDDWYCVLSPTPFMAQCHLLMWSRHPEDEHIMQLSEEGYERVKNAKSIAELFVKTKIEGGEKYKVQCGFHYPPTMPRLHMHVLIGNMTQMGLENEKNVNGWLSWEEVFQLKEQKQKIDLSGPDGNVFSIISTWSIHLGEKNDCTTLFNKYQSLSYNEILDQFRRECGDTFELVKNIN